MNNRLLSGQSFNISLILGHDAPPRRDAAPRAACPHFPKVYSIPTKDNDFIAHFPSYREALTQHR